MGRTGIVAATAKCGRNVIVGLPFRVVSCTGLNGVTPVVYRLWVLLSSGGWPLGGIAVEAIRRIFRAIRTLLYLRAQLNSNE